MAMRNKEASMNHGGRPTVVTAMNSIGTQIRNIPIPSPPSLSSSSEDESDELSDDEDASGVVSSILILLF